VSGPSGTPTPYCGPSSPPRWGRFFEALNKIIEYVSNSDYLRILNATQLVLLSHRNARAAFSDIEPALSVFLSQKLDRTLAVKPLVGIREALEENGFIDPMPSAPVTKRDYAAIAA
jgi:hypothetical protein